MLNETKEKIIQYVLNNPKSWKKWLSSIDNKKILEELNIEIQKPKSLKEKVFWLINGLNDYPKCKTCGGNVTAFKSIKKGYNKHCSCRCAQLDLETRKKFEATNLLKYGTKNPAQSKVVQDKMKNTCLEKYGATNIFGSDIGKKKIKETNLKRYGVENPQQNAEIKEKTKQTAIEKYGVSLGHFEQEYFRSKGEIEVFEFLKSFFPNIKHSDRKQIWPMELDIFIPELNIGIEYDGDYWHNLPAMIERDTKKDEICKQKQIHLIRIREKDWKNNNEYVKNFLKEELNIGRI